MTLKAAVVIVGAFTTASLIAAQGVYILATGRLFPYAGLNPKPLRHRVSAGLLYLLSGGVFLTVAAWAAVRSGLGAAVLARWAVSSWFLLVVVLTGLLLLLHPSTGVKWVSAAAPEIPPDDERMLLIARLVGAMMALAGLFAVCLSLQPY